MTSSMVRYEGTSPKGYTPDQKYFPDQRIPVSEAMDRIVTSVIRGYRFTNLQEFNAVLRLYNLTVETGGLESKTRQHNGLYYVGLDERGNKISPPVMASQLASRPTYKKLEATFERTLANVRTDLVAIRQRLDLVLFYKPDSLYQFAAELRGHEINVVALPLKDNQPFDLVYIDHRYRTAAAGRSLGEAYTADSMLRTIDNSMAGRLDPNLQKAPGLTMHIGPYGAGFSTRVPQPVYEALTPDVDWDGYQQNLHLGRRIGR